MNDFIKYSILFMYYKDLFSDKQKMYLEAYLEEDNSLTEVAEAFGISRQAVFDNIKRGFKRLDSYENKLGIMKREKEVKEKLNKLKDNFSIEVLDEIIQELELDYNEEL